MLSFCKRIYLSFIICLCFDIKTIWQINDKSTNILLYSAMSLKNVKTAGTLKFLITKYSKAHGKQ